MDSASFNMTTRPAGMAEGPAGTATEQSDIVGQKILVAGTKVPKWRAQEVNWLPWPNCPTCVMMPTLEFKLFHQLNDHKALFMLHGFIPAVQLLPAPDQLHPDISFPAAVHNFLVKWLYSGWMEMARKEVTTQLQSDMKRDTENLQSKYDTAIRELKKNKEDVTTVSRVLFNRESTLSRVRKRADSITRQLRRARVRNEVLNNKYNQMSCGSARYGSEVSLAADDTEDHVEVGKVEPKTPEHQQMEEVTGYNY